MRVTRERASTPSPRRSILFPMLRLLSRGRGLAGPSRPRGGRAGGHICLTARGVRGHAGARRAYRTHALCVRHVREMCAASARRGALCADLQRPRLHSRARAGESPGPGRALHTCARPSRAHSPCRPALSGGPEAGLARRARQALCRVRPSECQAKPAVWASFTNFKRFASRPPRARQTAPGSAMRGQARLAAITAGMSMLCVLGMAQKWDVSTISDEVLATPLPCSCLDLSLCRHPRRCVWVSTEGLEFVVSEIVLGS